MTDQWKNLQAAARRRNLSLVKATLMDDDEDAPPTLAILADRNGTVLGMFADLREVAAELRGHPIEK
jgi:hypothetical protein